MKRTLFTSFTALLSTLAVVSSVSRVASAAETTPAPPPPSDSSAEHLSGLEIGLRPTLGSVGSSPVQAAENDASVPQPFRPGASMYGSSIGGGLQLGFRFHPLVSAGLRGDLGRVGSRDATDGTTNLSRSWQSGGLYARIYPLALNETARRYVDPWVATGIMYVHDGQTFDTPTPTNGGGKINVAWQGDSHAIGVPIGIGLDYRVTKWLSAGPSFEYVIMNPIAGCVKGTAAGQEARTCTDETKGSKGIVAVADGAWNAGISFRVTPF